MDTNLALVIATIVLAGITGFYAWQTRNTVREMREQRYDLVRPVLDIQPVSEMRNAKGIDLGMVGSANIERGLAAQSKDLSQGLLCIIRNIGLGPAMDVYSFIQVPSGIPVPNGRRIRWEFGTVVVEAETNSEHLSMEYRDRKALLVYYRDVSGRIFESSRAVSIDQDKHNLVIGSLKVRQIREDELP